MNERPRMSSREEHPGQPIEPADWYLDRIEAAAELVARSRCAECNATPTVVSWQPGTGLPRAMTWRHEPECSRAPAEED